MMSKVIRAILFCLTLSFSTLAFSFDLSMLSSMKISKPEIQESLKMLKAQGVISEADFNKAMAELAKMSDKDIEEKKSQAIKAIKDNPGAVNKALSGEAQTPEDMKKLMDSMQKSGKK